MTRRLKRLLSMSVSELAYRSCENARREIERFRHLTGRGAATRRPPGRRPVSWREYLAATTGSRFYFATDRVGRSASRELVRNLYPVWIEEAVREAESVLAGRVEILGCGPLDVGTEVNWHHDPLRNRTWERRFWADYDLVAEGARCDPKIVHELNRHQHLARLGKTYFLTGDEKFAAAAVSQIGSWIEQNPPKTGVHWHSSLEAAIRCLSWIWTIAFISGSESLDERSAGGIADSLLDQIEHVYRYPSVYSSPNTHLIGEATVLAVAGLLFPELPEASAWRRRGMAFLLRELDHQVLPDGAHAELSSYYHCYTIDFYLQAFVLARQRGEDPPAWAWQRVLRMLDFLKHLSGAGGETPRLGDDDGGRALALKARDYQRYGDGLVVGAVLFGRSDFKYQSGGFREEALWLLGAPGWRSFEALSSSPPSNRSVLFPDSGYAVQRSGWGPDASRLVFDCGGLGLSSGAHAHADALSVTLKKCGEDLLIDPGTFQYGGAPEWRDYFRSTRAHNTVTVDGADQSRTEGTFSWKTRASTRIGARAAFSGVEYIEAEHDGYAGAGGVIHRRRVVFVAPHYWILADEFDGKDEHRYDFHYHFPPEADISVGPGQTPQEVEAVATGHRAGILLFSAGVAPLEAGVIRGHTFPVGGWASSHYGARRPSPVLRASMTAKAPAAAVTFLMPLELQKLHELDPDRYFARTIEGEGWLAYAFDHGDYEDVAVVNRGASEIRIEACRMSGEFFWLRRQKGKLVQAMAIRARRFTYAGNAVLVSASPESAFFEFSEDWVAVEHAPRRGKIYVRHLWNSEIRQ